MESGIDMEPRHFQRQSPYLDSVQKHHDSDYRYATYVQQRVVYCPDSSSVLRVLAMQYWCIENALPRKTGYP